MNCKECEKEGVINPYVVNKIHQLCKDHNQSRLKPNVVNFIGMKINKKKNFHQEIASEREQKCSGCGNPNNLSHSHLIAISKRKDLEFEKNNIKYHCLVRQDGSMGCHSMWESNDFSIMGKLLDFEENMLIIEKLDIKHYNFLYGKNGITL